MTVDKTVLETARLLVRPFAVSDVDDVHRLLYADPAVADNWTGLSRTREDVQKRFATHKAWRLEQEFGFRAVVLKVSGIPIGLMGLQKYEIGEDTSYIVFPDGSSPVGRDPTVLEAELTYALGRAYWGQGYATEAGLALLNHGFTHAGVGRIVNEVRAANVRSVKLMKRLGFRIIPNLRPHADGPGIIGILDNPTLQERATDGA
jgi:RimJ/RimL family protein N-acetyltransferase